MRYDNPELRERLAADYVLGTLRGRARWRFESLLRSDAGLAGAVLRWEEQLAPLIDAVPPVEPPAHLWQAIERTTGGARAAAERAPKPGLWASLAFWRGLGLAATAAAAALVLFVALRPAPQPPSEVAMLNDEAGHAAYLVEVENGRRLALSALTVSEPGAGHAYQLWLLPKDGNPRPLGLLPTSGRVTLDLSGPDQSLLPQAIGLAVSLEPPGGSPTGLPTGPVLYKGALYEPRGG